MICPRRLRGSIGWQFIIIFAGWFLSLGAPAIAQESAPSPENTQTGWIFRWIIFAIVFAAMVRAFVKSAPALKSRSEEISQKIAEGARAREAAEKQRRDVQTKLAGIDTEVTKLREEAKKSMEAEATRLKALARREAELIEQAARAEIAAAQRAASLELKAMAARLAIERAEAVLTKEITPEAQASLFRTFVLELERGAN
jgi:F0F1-type ATP synthase membrane subunit b/b'